MFKRNTHIISRRSTLIGLSAATLSTLLIPQTALAITTTPQQTEGPFYPEAWTGDIDNDLVVVKGEATRSMGTIIHLNGTITDLSAKPVTQAMVEIWQCDANGVYRHSEDTSPTRRTDKGFQGYGRTLTDKNGNYSFRTIKPVSYPGRTPHIHFRVKAKNKPTLTTQMYVFGEPQNQRDFILNDIRNKEKRESLIVKFTPADRIEQGALAGTFNIILA